MKHLHQAFCGALLVVTLAGIAPAQAKGGTHWDPTCNCRRADSQYNTRRYVREPLRVTTRQRVVNHTRVVRGRTKLVQENRLIVHVRPVIDREVVVHRTNTIVKDVVLHRVKTTHKVHEEHRREVVHRYVQGSVRHVVERREVRGVSCNCGNDRRSRGERISYRN